MQTPFLILIATGILIGTFMGWLLRGLYLSAEYRAMERVLQQVLRDRNR
jgi:hypothetical protein